MISYIVNYYKYKVYCDTNFDPVLNATETQSRLKTGIQIKSNYGSKLQIIINVKKS